MVGKERGTEAASHSTTHKEKALIQPEVVVYTLVPTCKRQRQVISEFKATLVQDSQGFIMRPCVEKSKTNKHTKNYLHRSHEEPQRLNKDNKTEGLWDQPEEM